MSFAVEITMRLIGAALIGATIGYERELRAKGAGLRTHVLVAVGSCLFMLISQFGFEGAERFDAARVAAGVVGGLGFLGGGIIMKTKNHVSGLTTAAGLWVTGAIGMAMGSGMYEMSFLCTIVILICMEALSFYTIKLGQQEVAMSVSAKDEESLQNFVNAFENKIKHFSIRKQDDKYVADMSVMFPKKHSGLELMRKITSVPGIELISME